MWIPNYGKTKLLLLPWVKPVNVKYPDVAKRIQINTETKMDTWMRRDHLATVRSSKEPYTRKQLWWQTNAANKQQKWLLKQAPVSSFYFWKFRDACYFGMMMNWSSNTLIYEIHKKIIFLAAWGMRIFIHIRPV